MLEVTSTSAEAEHGIDFAQIYKESALYKYVYFTYRAFLSAKGQLTYI